MKLGYVIQPAEDGRRGATDALLIGIAQALMAQGVRLAGTVQTNTDRACTHHCDMDVHVLPDGPVLRISQDLGPGSTGCRLNPEVLETAVAEVERRMDGAEMLIVNKFGKHEAEGRGFRTVMAEALSRGLPVLVGVNGLNLPAFRRFAEGFASQLPAEPRAILAWLDPDRAEPVA